LTVLQPSAKGQQPTKSTFAAPTKKILHLIVFASNLTRLSRMASKKIFSLEGKGLKLDTAEDIEPHIQPLHDATDIEEVHLLGNTLGIGASEALAKALESQKNLEVKN